VPAFIAANYIMTYYSDHNICALRTKLPAKSDTVVVNRNVNLAQIAAVLDIDLDMLRTLNPEYRRDIVPGLTKPSAIKMGLNDVTRFIVNEDSIYNYNAAELLSKRDEVAINDDVPTFVKKKTTRRSRNSRASRRSSSRSKKGAAGRSVTIRRGETLSQIAKRNGTTVAKLKRLNGIRGNNIKAGKKLKVR
jgi:membrane-bound lytic murein transglycosylase D